MCPFNYFNACRPQCTVNGRPSAANTAALTGRRALIPIRASSYKCLSSAAAILAPAVAAAAAAPAAGRRQWSTGNPANAAGRGRNQHQNKKPPGLAVLICPNKLRAGAVALLSRSIPPSKTAVRLQKKRKAEKQGSRVVLLILFLLILFLLVAVQVEDKERSPVRTSRPEATGEQGNRTGVS